MKLIGMKYVVMQGDGPRTREVVYADSYNNHEYDQLEEAVDLFNHAKFDLSCGFTGGPYVMTWIEIHRIYELTDEEVDSAVADPYSLISLREDLVDLDFADNLLCTNECIDYYCEILCNRNQYGILSSIDKIIEEYSIQESNK